MKRITALILTFTLVCVTLAGCGGGDSLVTPLQPEEIVPFDYESYTLLPAAVTQQQDVGGVLYSEEDMYFIYRQKLFYSDGETYELLLQDVVNIAGANAEGIYLIALYDGGATEEHEGPVPTDVGIYNPTSDAYTYFLRDIHSATLTRPLKNHMFYARQENTGEVKTFFGFDLSTNERQVIVFEEGAQIELNGQEVYAKDILFWELEDGDVAAFMSYPNGEETYIRTLVLSVTGRAKADSEGIIADRADSYPEMPTLYEEQNGVRTYTAGNFELIEDTQGGTLSLQNIRTGSTQQLTAQQVDAMVVEGMQEDE